MSDNGNISVYRQQLRERIIETSMRAFSAQGIRAVKMDDIARQLSISKRTLYELYENKETVLCEGVRYFHSKREQHMKELVQRGKSVIDIVLEAYRQRLEELRGTSSQFYDDLKKYPRVLEILEDNKRHNHQRFVDFLHRGVEEGYFRSDLDYDIVPLMFDAIGRYIMLRELYRQFDMEQVFKSLVFTSLRGICTAMGAKALDEGL